MKEIKNNRAYQILLLMLAGMVIFSLFLFLCYKYDNKYLGSSSNAINGIVELSENKESKITFLSEGWEYYQGILIEPEDIDSYILNREFITIGEFNDFKRGKEENNPYGCGTYRIRIRVEDELVEYALYLQEIFSAYECFVNGIKKCSMGQPSDRKTSSEKIGNRTVFLHGSDEYDVVIKVSNYSHYYSGMVYPPALGRYENITSYVNIVFLAHASVMVVCILIIIICLGMQIKFRSLKSICFAILCACFMISCGYPIFFWLFDIENTMWYGVELFAIYASYPLIVYLQGKIAGKNDKLNKWILVLLTGIAAFSAIYGMFAMPEIIHNYFPLISFAAKIITAFYLVINGIRSVKEKNIDSNLLLIATSIYSISLFEDRIFPLYEPIYGGFFQEYGAVLMIISIGVILSNDFISAYNFQMIWLQDRKILKRQLVYQKEQYNRLNATIDEMRRQRHDYRHHMSTVMAFLSEKDIDGAKEYLKAYSKEIEQKKVFTLCDNPILDSMFRSYLALCEENNINIRCKVDYPKEMPFEDTEISILFGNLMENAYHACEEYQGESPSIFVKGMYVNNLFMLRIENSFSNKIKMENERFITTKKRGEGIGVQSVKAIIKQYNGNIEFKTEDNIFTVSIMINF